MQCLVRLLGELSFMMQKHLCGFLGSPSMPPPQPGEQIPQTADSTSKSVPLPGVELDGAHPCVSHVTASERPSLATHPWSRLSHSCATS